VPEVAVAHIGGQQRELSVDVGFFSIPPQESMYRKGSPQFVKVRCAAANAAVIFLAVVNPKMLEHTAEIEAGPVPSVGSPIGQKQEQESLRGNPEHLLSRLQEIIQVGTDRSAYWDESILEKLRALYIEGGMFGRV